MYMNKILKILIFSIFFLPGWQKVHATHVVAGEVTFRQISAYSYEIIVYTYTDIINGMVDRDYVYVDFGDNSNADLPRVYKLDIENGIRYNVYQGVHTYPGPGTYTIQHLEHNRQGGIRNMKNSVFTPFYVETQLQINPAKGNNRSPVLLQAPIDYAQLGTVFVHNPNAYDPDGDSLVFTLIPPKQARNINVQGYYKPYGVNGFTLDSYTGELIWNYPDTIGQYNIAILVEEYRNNVRIGYVIRDMQIIVGNGNNHPPVIEPINDTCILAGSNYTLNIRVQASDPDPGQRIKLTATGGPFLHSSSKAVMTPDPASGQNLVQADFSWTVSCDQIRKEPYRVVFKAHDNDLKNPLADLEYFDIQVVGPAPENLNITNTITGMLLNWDPPQICNNVQKYNIYRKMDSSYWDTSTCETGIPPYTGFKKIASIIGKDSTSYFDNNGGTGFLPGVTYCYRVTAEYLTIGENYELVEGYASHEVCARQRKDYPVLTHVDVRHTDKTQGSIFVQWSKPVELDTFLFPGPYKYKLYRSETQGGASLILIDTFVALELWQLNDSNYIDTFLNTTDKSYYYILSFFGNNQGQDFLLGNSPAASSVYLNLIPAHQTMTLRWNAFVPWRNYEYTIYKQNKTTGKWDSLATTQANTYSDTGLVNGKRYCYKVKASGTFYGALGFVDPLINHSQINCSSPRDTIAPCAPLLFGQGYCDLFYTDMNWTFEDFSCAKNVIAYQIYYSPLQENSFQRIDRIEGKYNNSYTDQRPELKNNLAGCYYVTAIDSYMNESLPSNQICVDNCPFYELPNIFTPNGDNMNDLFVPLDGSKYVGYINIRIYNRWGQIVFQTTNPEILWDGKDYESGEDCLEGTYYYVCDVYEMYLEGQKVSTKKGTITLIR
jgi:gliding motility-associated-like protein